MHTEMKDITIRVPRPTQSYVSPEDDPLWDALTSSRISMPLHKLLQLMPQFKDTLASLTSDIKSTSLPVNLAELGTGPPLMDSQNHGFPEPRGENHHRRTRHSWLNHRRRFWCQRDQRSHMPRPRPHPVGTMSFLALDGRHSIGLTYRVNSPSRFYVRRSHVHNLGGSITPRSS